MVSSSPLLVRHGMCVCCVACLCFKRWSCRSIAEKVIIVFGWCIWHLDAPGNCRLVWLPDRTHDCSGARRAMKGHVPSPQHTRQHHNPAFDVEARHLVNKQRGLLHPIQTTLAPISYYRAHALNPTASPRTDAIMRGARRVLPPAAAALGPLLIIVASDDIGGWWWSRPPAAAAAAAGADAKGRRHRRRRRHRTPAADRGPRGQCQARCEPSGWRAGLVRAPRHDPINNNGRNGAGIDTKCDPRGLLEARGAATAAPAAERHHDERNEREQ